MARLATGGLRIVSLKKLDCKEFTCNECGLVVLTFFKTSLMKRINMHLSSPIYFLCFSDIVSEVW